MYIGLHVKYPLFLADFNKFSRQILVSNFTKIRPERPMLFHAGGWRDGQTDITKPIVAFRNFANAPTNRPVRILS